MSSVVYGDCPACGKIKNLSSDEPKEIVNCPACGVGNYAEWWLNLRNTPQRVDPRGWFGRLFLGSALQKSEAEQRAGDRATLLSNIEAFRYAVRIAERQEDFQRATFYQRKLEYAEEQLEDFDN